jgi:cobalt-precorrin 5A hydrolase
MAELWVGMGCQEDITAVSIAEAIRRTLLAHDLDIDEVVGLATLEQKAKVAISVCALYHWKLCTFEAEELAKVAVPRPVTIVEREVGTASVAEASAILAADYLLVPKQIHSFEGKFVTIAIGSRQL